MERKMSANNKLVFVIFVALALSSFAASSSTVIFNSNGLEAFDSVKRITPESSKTLDGGMFDLDQVGGTYIPSLMANSPSEVNKFSAFCLEPNVGINPGSTYTVGGVATASMYSFAAAAGGIGQAKADHIAELMYQVYPVFGVALSDQNALAIQIALWEIVREEQPGSYDLLSGDVSFEDNVGAISLAQTWLSSYVGTGGPKLDNLLALTMDGGQDLLVQTVTAVPIPAAVWLFGTGLVGLMGVRKRRS